MLRHSTMKENAVCIDASTVSLHLHYLLKAPPFRTKQHKRKGVYQVVDEAENMLLQSGDIGGVGTMTVARLNRQDL